MPKNNEMTRILSESYFVEMWVKEQISHFQLKYGDKIPKTTLYNYLCDVVQERLYNPFALLENNYLEKTAQTDLLSIIDLVHKERPIIGGNGVLFYQHTDKENPMLDWITSIMENRKKYKKLRAQYPKGSEEFAYYDLMQLLEKLKINSLYGAFGYARFIFANIYLSTAVTMLGQNTISSAAMGFEAFLADNAKFVEENEVYRFIRQTSDEAIALDMNVPHIFDPWPLITVEMVAQKIVKECLFPLNNRQYDTIKQMLNNMNQNQLTLLYYKNNLYEFCRTPMMRSKLIDLHHMVESLTSPDITQLSSDAVNLVEFIWKMLRTFVIYDYPIYDRVRKNKYTYKKSVAYQDTDSNFIVLSTWVHFIMEEVMPADVPSDSDELESMIFKIVNIFTIFVTRVVSASFNAFTKSLNIDDDHRKLLAMKNEFYYTRILFTPAKKRYVGRPRLQEGNLIPAGKDIDIKGFDFKKATTKDFIRDTYEKICYNDILTPANIDIEKIFLKIVQFEQEMRDGLKRGDRKYFKQSNVKQAKEYKTPYRIQGVKGTLLWNTLNPEYAIQLPTDVDIVPITLERNRRKSLERVGGESGNPWDIPIGVDQASGRKILMRNGGKEMIRFAEAFPDEFDRLRSEILTNANPDIRSMSLNCIAMPKNSDIPLPEWFSMIVDQDKIVNDALTLFYPIMKSLGITILKCDTQTEHYSNIVSL